MKAGRKRRICVSCKRHVGVSELRLHDTCFRCRYPEQYKDSHVDQFGNYNEYCNEWCLHQTNPPKKLLKVKKK